MDCLEQSGSHHLLTDRILINEDHRVLLTITVCGCISQPVTPHLDAPIPPARQPTSRPTGMSSLSSHVARQRHAFLRHHGTQRAARQRETCSHASLHRTSERTKIFACRQPASKPAVCPPCFFRSCVYCTPLPLPVVVVVVHVVLVSGSLLGCLLALADHCVSDKQIGSELQTTVAKEDLRSKIIFVLPVGMCINEMKQRMSAVLARIHEKLTL
ncbi:hypothetical protein HDK90DRAFT_311250 [Phyllosticta capitalensis]|uniref:Uncharacterized protein n=1 Tax=Phyllosticta capitalensis TaxID=121624 RepID=A0ABR1YLU0_9PEZI